MWTHRIGFCVIAALLCGALSPAQAQPAPRPAATRPSTAPATQPKAGDQQLPGIHVDRDAGHVELDAKVVNRDADWLELLVCSPGSREYESILTSPARPSHIHLALLMLGLEPGSPLDWRRVENGQAGEDRFEVDPPTGPRLRVICMWQQDGESHRAPANTWVEQQRTGEPMQGELWLFAGSQFVQHEGRQLYMADLNGTVLSLVNFGDDLLTRPTTMTNRSDNRAWGTRTKVIPPKGTPVTLRLVPAPDAPMPGDDAAATQPTDTRPAATQPFAPPR